MAAMPPEVCTVRLLGAAGTVTGSRFLVEAGGSRILVDCGLFQGLKELRRRNWARFPVEPSSLDAVVLTHAHLDHSGYLPALVRDGFAGAIHTTRPTARLADIVLADSGRLQEEEAAYANRKGYSKHRPALPLYTEADARAVSRRFAHHRYGETFEPAPGLQVTLRRAGHILGSASVEVSTAAGSVVFSGDLGRRRHPILLPPEPPPPARMVFVESTYGDREHLDLDEGVERLADVVRRTAERGGAVVIPAFAVDRTEVILYHLHRLADEGRIPALGVYVDSPLALAALGVYRDELGDPAEFRPEVGLHPFDPGNLVEARTVAQSKAINHAPLPAIIVSASGMATGGRVLHHLARRLPDPKNAVVLVGYQAAGTRGRRLLEGERAIKIHGSYVPVRAEVVDIPAFSVHADRSELTDWVGSSPQLPELVVTVHGEPGPAASLAAHLADTFDLVAVPGRDGEILRL